MRRSARRRWKDYSTAPSSWSCATAARRPTGGCSPPSRPRGTPAARRVAGYDRTEAHALRSMAAITDERAEQAVLSGQDASAPDAAVVRAFGSGLPLDRDELLAAPVRWPRPSRLREPLKAPGRAAAAGLRSLGLETVGDLLEHLPSA